MLFSTIPFWTTWFTAICNRWCRQEPAFKAPLSSLFSRLNNTPFGARLNAVEFVVISFKQYAFGARLNTGCEFVVFSVKQHAYLQASLNLLGAA